jgi:hypothetical protein
MIDADNWPSLGAELGRKTAGVIERWMAQYEAGRLTFREFYLIVNALYDTTSGLAPQDISDMLATIEKELRNEASSRKKAQAAL